VIKKILKIENVGKFKNYAPSGDVEFRKLTLIYSENGRGKTTLSSILHSLKTDDPFLIIERTTLGVASSPSVTILLDTETTSFDSTKWSAPYRDIEIFDSTFITNNICAGPYVEHDHKKNLYRFVIGDVPVSHVKRIADLDQESREVSKELANKESLIRQAMVLEISIESFIQLEKINNIDEQITGKQEDLKAAEKAHEITKKPNLKLIPLPNLSVSDLYEVINRAIDGLSGEAIEKVKGHFKSHHSDSIESWARDGTKYLEHNCPYCGLSVDGNDLVAAYGKYFSDAYLRLANDLTNFLKNVRSVFSDKAIGDIQGAFESNSLVVEVWNRLVAIYLPDYSVSNAQDAIQKLRDVLIGLLEEKIANPTKQVDAKGALKDHIDEYNKQLQSIKSYNDSIETANKSIELKKRELTGTNVQALRSEISHLENVRKRWSNNISHTCTDFVDLKSKKERIEDEKQKEKDALNKVANEVLNNYQADINQYLEHFGVDYQISEVKNSYLGGNPSSTYKLSINGVTYELGDPETPRGVPCFGNTLSTGDKTTMAFAFFLAKLKRDPALQKKTIIIDDPISSLDNHRKKCTVSEIAGLLPTSKQIVVLSHDPHFLFSIWDAAPKDSINTLNILRSGENSIIGPWDIEQETQAEYFKNYFVLSDYLEHGPNGNRLRDVARCIRPLLEGNLRICFPGSFNRNEWLGDFIKKVREAGSADRLHVLKRWESELTQINDYSKQYHHEQNPSGFSSAPIQDSELKAFVKRTLKLIGGIYQAPLEN